MHFVIPGTRCPGSRYLFSFPPSPSLLILQQRSRINMFSGLINSSTVSVDIQPTATTSTIALATVYQLGLLPEFDRYGRYTCDPSLSVPTNNGFYTSRTPLLCSHVSGESDIVLGSDWVSASGSMLCADGSGLTDPPQSVIASLPTG